MSETAAKTMKAYIVETTDGVFKVSIPEAWALDVTFGQGGYANAKFIDEAGSTKLGWINVLVVRDTGTPIQELGTTVGEEEDSQITGYEWLERSPDEPMSRYSADTIAASSNRRRRRARVDNRTIQFDQDTESAVPEPGF